MWRLCSHNGNFMAHYIYSDTLVSEVSARSWSGFTVTLKLLFNSRNIFVQNQICFTLPMHGQHMCCNLTVDGMCGLYSFTVFTDWHALICLNWGLKCALKLIDINGNGIFCLSVTQRHKPVFITAHSMLIKIFFWHWDMFTIKVQHKLQLPKQLCYSFNIVTFMICCMAHVLHYINFKYVEKRHISGAKWNALRLFKSEDLLLLCVTNDNKLHMFGFLDKTCIWRIIHVLWEIVSDISHYLLTFKRPNDELTN